MEFINNKVMDTIIMAWITVATNAAEHSSQHYPLPKATWSPAVMNTVVFYLQTIHTKTMITLQYIVISQV